MKHHLIKKLRSEIKTLKARIRELENRKPDYSNPIAELIDRPIDINALAEHYRLNKYGR